MVLLKMMYAQYNSRLCPTYDLDTSQNWLLGDTIASVRVDVRVMNSTASCY